MAQTKYKLVIEGVNKTKKAFASVKQSLAKVGGAAKGAAKVVGGIGLAVAAVATAFVAMGKKAFDALDSIGKTASRTGIAAESLQALRLGAVESGSSVEALNKAIEKFSKNIGDVIVKGTGEATYALDRMGISLYDSAGALKDNDQILREVADGIKNMASETEKNSALQGLFGRQGILMNQVFGEGAVAIDRWIAKAKEMGFVVSGTAIKSVEAFNDRFAELKFMLTGLVNQTFAALAPGLEKMITDFNEWAIAVNGAGNNLEKLGKKIAENLVEGLATAIESLGTTIVFFRQMSAVMEKWGAMLNVKIGKGMKEEFQEIRQEFLANILAIYEFEEQTKKAAAKLRAFWKVTKDGKKPLKDIKDETEETTVRFKELTEAVEGFGKGFDEVFINSETKLEKFAKLGEKVGKTLEDGLVDAFMNIEKGAEGLRDMMDQILKQIMAELVRVFIVQASVQALKTWWGARAEGGPVSAGKPYLVGEKGPELFVPGSSGGIVPNDQLAGAGAGAGANVNVNFNITSWDSRDTLQAISQQAPAIVGIVEQSFKKRGRRGPLGP
jgi:hypothetical protein